MRDDMVTRVRGMLERSRKSLKDGSARQRLEGQTKQLLQRSRETVAQFVGAPPPPPKEIPEQEVLAGVCSSVALRDLNLVDALLEQLEQMEANEEDPDALARLYKLDHLATRLRRNSENLRVLAGSEASGVYDATTPIVDVLRAAVSSIEHYPRVELGKVATLGVVGFVADDISRLLSELLDNATTHSPPTSMVTVSAHLTEQASVLVRIEDSGIGLPAARLDALNERLSHAPVLDRNAVEHMGLAVVRRLASKHSIRVWLARRAPHGTTASVLLPPDLVQEAPVPSRQGRRGQDSPEARPAEWPRSAEPADPRSGSAEPAQKSAESGESSPMTINGLPKRVPHSLKDSAPAPSPGDARSGRSEREQRESHEQLLADLGEFAAGEQDAQEHKQEHNDTPKPVEGHEQ